MDNICAKLFVDHDIGAGCLRLKTVYRLQAKPILECKEDVLGKSEYAIDISQVEVADEATFDEAMRTAVYVESDDELRSIAHIAVHGKYERAYTLILALSALGKANAIIDDERLIICTWYDLIVIDLAADSLQTVIRISDFGTMFAIYKFSDGFFIHGELENFFLDRDFNVLWSASAADIFVNPDPTRNIKIFDDHITVWDFLDNKHYYNLFGEYKTEYIPPTRKEN